MSRSYRDVDIYSYGTPGWHAARQLFDASLDRRPSYALRPRTLSAAVEVTSLMQQGGEDFTIRSGGHSAAGLSVRDGVPVIDVSMLRGVSVDVDKQEVTVEAGALIADLDRATTVHSLATTGGTVSHTGLVGLACGGGLGWLMARFGLACDNIVRASLVADGEHRVLDAGSVDMPTLRGRGTTLGFVATLTLRLHPIDPVFRWTILHIRDARVAVRGLAHAVAAIPDCVGCSLSIDAAPGGIVTGFFDVIAPDGNREAARWCNDLGGYSSQRGDELMSYAGVQTALDKDFPFGGRSYRRSVCVDDLLDIDWTVLLRALSKPSGFRRTITIDVLHGAAMSRVARSKSVFRRRCFTVLFITRWEEPSLDERGRLAGRELLSISVDPLSDHVAYGNYSSDPADSQP